MAYEIFIHEIGEEELRQLRTFDRVRVLDEIAEQLMHQPTLANRRRKCLENLSPSFEHAPPIWELRVGAFRVFYDVDDESKQVHVRAIREKPPDRTTEQIV
jgi:mRNA-degrading endonuclease RelE of RelBE toxin-antitoxin system